MLLRDLRIPEQARKLLINSGVSKLFPPQEAAVKAGALKGKNIVLASPTASGKTLVAEICALRHLLDQEGKVIYLSPLRALASEKYIEFKKYESLIKSDGFPLKVGISTGDYDDSDPWLRQYDIIICTNEKCDSLLRHRAPWIDEVSLVVADEIHLLNDRDRGPTLEVVLARILQQNPNIQVLALSATIRNVKEIAEWLQAVPVSTNWRPVKLKEGVLKGSELHFQDGSTAKIGKGTSNPAVNLALYSIQQGGQALIFTSTRRNSVSLAKKVVLSVDKTLSKKTRKSLDLISISIKTKGERTKTSRTLAELIKKGTAFHHAGLVSSHRKIIEDSFREGKIKVITSTPTLAFGVNLPARMVIISNYKRYEPGYGYYPISVLEYKQMAGRAGRPKYDKTGESVLIAKTDEELEYLLRNYVLSRPERIWSKLGIEKTLRAHVLATIASEFATSKQDLNSFFQRTLFAFQYDLKAIEETIANILRFLKREQMIKSKGPVIKATKFGLRVSQLYLDPISAIIIRKGLFNQAPKLSNISFLHLIAHTPNMFPKIRCSNSEINQTNLFLNQHNREIMFEEPNIWVDQIEYEEFLGEVKSAWVLNSWIEESSEDDILEKFRVESGDLYRLISNSEWLLYASSELARLFDHNDLVPWITRLRERVIKGVKMELLLLTKLDGIGRKRARILYEDGLGTIEALQRASIERIANLPSIGAAVAKRIIEQIGIKNNEKQLSELKNG